MIVPVADDPHQAPTLIVIDLAYSQPFRHRISLDDRYLRRNRPGQQTRQQIKIATALAVPGGPAPMSVADPARFTRLIELV